MSSPATHRLVQLFEQELRELDAGIGEPTKRKPIRVSRDLNRQVVEYVSEVRTQGSTPERMLVELKAALNRAAPDVPTSQRNALLAELTGRAITAFFRRDGPKSNSP